MTEIEKIEYAKQFIDKLADGINPIDDTIIPENDITNNVRLSRCFFFVSGILRQVIENGGVSKYKKKVKVPFSLTVEQSESIEFSEQSIAVSDIAKRIYAAAKNENMSKLSYRQINQWLLNIGMLCLCDEGGKAFVKRPTEEGLKLGITVESKMGRYGEYKVVLYNEMAQRFIVDNIDAILATEVERRKR